MATKFFALAVSAGFLANAAADDEAAHKALMEAGAGKYMVCAACHGQDGKGMAAGDKLMAPTLVNSPIANGEPSVLALVLLNGIAKEGDEYLGVMAPLKAMLATDEELAAVMTYVRQSFGNKAAAVTAEEAKAYRAKWKEKAAPVTRAELVEFTKPAAEEKKSAE